MWLFLLLLTHAGPKSACPNLQSKDWLLPPPRKKFDLFFKKKGGWVLCSTKHRISKFEIVIKISKKSSKFEFDINLFSRVFTKMTKI